MSQEGRGDQPASSSLLGLGAAGLDLELDLCLGLPSGGGPTTVGPPDLTALAERNAQDEAHPALLQSAGLASQMPVSASVPIEQLQCVGASSTVPPGLAAPAPPVEITLFVGGVPANMDGGTLRMVRCSLFLGTIVFFLHETGSCRLERSSRHVYASILHS